MPFIETDNDCDELPDSTLRTAPTQLHRRNQVHRGAPTTARDDTSTVSVSTHCRQIASSNASAAVALVFRTPDAHSDTEARATRFAYAAANSLFASVTDSNPFVDGKMSNARRAACDAAVTLDLELLGSKFTKG